MEITAFAVQMVIIAIPGVLCYFVLSKLIGKIGRDGIEVVLCLILFAMLSYLLYGIFLSGVNYFKHNAFASDIIEKALTAPGTLSQNDIIGATVTSLILASALSYAYTYGLLNRFAKLIRATYRYGDEDLWHYFHRVPDELKNDGWIVVRDHKFNLAYYGAVTVWSESDCKRELILTDVTVCDNATGDELYSSENIYICRNAEEISIEVPRLNNHGKESRNVTPREETLDRGDREAGRPEQTTAEAKT